MVADLLDWLDAHGLADNTIVIYTADQGYFLGEHGFNIYSGAERVIA